MGVTIAIAVAVLALLIYKSAAFKRWRYSKDLSFPEAPKRPLLFGYYSCHHGQASEVADHVNLHFESQFEGQDKAIENIHSMARVTILDLSAQMFTRTGDKGPFTLRDDALVHVVAFLRRLSDVGALKYVRYLYPIDEPNNTVQDEATLRKTIALVFEAASQFIELRGVRLAVIYAADKPFICQDAFALVGFDDYDMKSHVLVGDKYKQLKASLGVGQQIMIVPGGAYGQDPTPFINFANANAEVGAVVPFLWFDDQTGSVGSLGIRSNGMKDAYIAAGKSVCATS